MYETLKKARLSSCALWLIVGSLIPAHGALEIELSLSTEHIGLALPVSVDIGQWMDDLPSSCYLLDKRTGATIPCQLDEASGKLYFIAATKDKERQLTKRFLLQSGPRHRQPRMQILHTRGSLVIQDQGLSVAAYNYRMLLPDGMPERYRRSCYFHPIYGLDGQAMTEDFPRDHCHHRGLSWMWSHVTTAERDYDLWGLSGIRQRTEKALWMESGPVYARLIMANGWYTDDGQRLVQEKVSVRAFPSSETGRVVDLELVFEALGRPVTIGSSATGYGGLNLRFAPRTETKIVTSDRPVERNVDLQRFLWSDLSGKFGRLDDFSGIAIFDNPGNVAHPTGWTLRPYGILNPSFTSIGPVTLEPGKPLTVRYRLWIHRGDAESGRVAQAYSAYINPPTVKVVVTR